MTPCLLPAPIAGALWLVVAGFNLSVARAGRPPDAALAMGLLKAECLSCHNKDKRKGGLALVSREAMMAGGDEGAAVVVGRPEESPLVQHLAASADPHMPPKKQLSADKIALLTEWVRHGAPWDAAALAGESAPRAVALALLPTAYRPVMALALSPDGAHLAAGFGHEVVLFHIGEGGLVFKVRAHAHLDPVQSIAWLPDGKTLVTGAFRRVVFWQGETLTQQREIISGLTDRITVVLPSPAGGRVLLADGLVAEKGVVREAALDSGEIIRSWQAHDDTIFAMALSRDGKKLATAGGDRLVKLWDPLTGQETGRFDGHTSQVLSLAFHPDGSQLITGGADRHLKVWDVATRENVIALPGKSSAFNALQWNEPGPAVFAGMEDGAVLKYTDLKTHTGAQSSDTGKESRIAGVESALYALAVDAKGERIFAGTRDGRVLGWNKDGKLLDDLKASALAPIPSVNPP